MSRTLSIIMPAYNEGACIFDNIRTTHDVLKSAGLDAEIIVVDDGSLDNTFFEIERACALIGSVKPVRNPYNMGKGMALRTGFDYAVGDIIVFIDADLDLHPSQIHTLLSELENGTYDVVVTSKHHPDSQLSYPFSRKVSSYVYYLLIKALFGLPVRDTQTGLKIFKREVLDAVFHRLLVKTYAYDVELLAVAVRFGYKVHEIPVVLDFKRTKVWGRIRMTDIMRIFADTLAIFYRLKILKYYESERPLRLKNNSRVLIIVRGRNPFESVIKRLSLNTNTRVVCLGAHLQGDAAEGISTFPDETALQRWLEQLPDPPDYIGFLSSDCHPVGSWVQNALRNFQDERVGIVCGPVVPGAWKSVYDKAAAMLYSSSLTAGSNSRLYSIRQVRDVRKGLSDNVFLRASLWQGTDGARSSWVVYQGTLFNVTPETWIMKYDPDVAVSKRIPPVFYPYLAWIFKEAFQDGYHYFDTLRRNSRIWTLFPVAVWCFIFFGWALAPLKLYWFCIFTYAAIILVNGMLYFEPLALPLFTVGMALDHLVRAFAVPAGFAWSLWKGMRAK